MSQLILISSCLQIMLGAALLVLWRIDRRYRYVRHWGWSTMLLGVGLLLSIMLALPVVGGWLLSLLEGAASGAVMASLFLQMMGTRVYRGLAWNRRGWSVALILSMLMIVAVARFDLQYAVTLAALVLAGGSWLCASWVGWGGNRGERLVALCFVAAGALHAISPLLHPLSLSPLTHALGLLVQTTLSLGLIMLSVARAHQEARQQAERFSRLAEHSLQGLVVLRDDRVLYANAAARGMFGRDPAAGDASELRLSEHVPDELRETARHRHRTVLADPQARVEWEEPRLGYDGRRLHIRGLSSHLDWDGEPAELLVMLDDTARQAALEALRRQALHDELTDLPNRNFAVERLRAMTVPDAPPFALISADLDRFQLVNESLGHATGDALLRAVGERLRQALPAQAMLARLGEDQFVVLAAQVADRAAAQDFVEQLLAIMAPPFKPDGVQLFVHMSVGVALFPQDAQDAPGLLRAADSAMHRAKGKAGASYSFFNPAVNQAAQHRLEAEQALGRALAGREFLLEYQPKYLAHSRRLCGFEALVRWQRPDGHRVSPAEFVPAAERTGQIKQLGDLILQIACDQLRDWQREFGRVVPVAVNVSPLQFEDADFIDRLLAHLARRGLPPSALHVEITETAAIGHVDRVLPQLVRLRAAGIQCALDDFGTGQSSLTMLRRLPIDAVKLDRSMIDPLPAPDASAVVQAACLLGESLKLDIIAEGVETEVQAQSAEALGCTQLQGYYLSRPLAAPLASALLETALQ